MLSRSDPVTGMTKADLAAWVRQSRHEQGCPEKVQDPAIIANVAALVTRINGASLLGDLDAAELAAEAA